MLAAQRSRSDRAPQATATRASYIWMSPKSSRDTETDTSTDSTDSNPPVKRRGLMQWAGVATVLVALVLGIAPLIGLTPTNDSTLRLYLAAGIILLAGREAVRGFVENFLG